MAFTINEYFSPSNYEIIRFVYFGDPLAFPTVDRWQEVKNVIEAEINSLDDKITELTTNLTKLEAKVAANEGDIDSMQNEIAGLKTRIAALEMIKIYYVESNKSIAVSK